MATAKPNERTSRLRELADYIDEAPDEPATNPNIHVHINPGDTGKFQAVEAKTVPDAPRSVAPGKVEWFAKTVTVVVGSAKTWPQAIALIALLAFMYAVYRAHSGK